MLDLNFLYSNLFEFNKAEYWILRDIKMVDENTAYILIKDNAAKMIFLLLNLFSFKK